MTKVAAISRAVNIRDIDAMRTTSKSKNSMSNDVLPTIKSVTQRIGTKMS